MSECNSVSPTIINECGKKKCLRFTLVLHWVPERVKKGPRQSWKNESAQPKAVKRKWYLLLTVCYYHHCEHHHYHWH